MAALFVTLPMAAMGMADGSNLKEGESFTTLGMVEYTSQMKQVILSHEP